MRILREADGAEGREIALTLNGYDEIFRLKPPTQGRFDLLYAGTLYLNRNPFPLLEAIDALLVERVFDSRRVSVTIVGSFERWTMDEVRAWAQGRAIDSVLTLLPPVPKQQLMPLFDEATVLVNIATGQPNQIPAKSFEYLAAGREVLTLTERDSDTSWLMKKAARGRSVDPRDSVALRQVLTDLYRTLVDSEQTSSSMFAPEEFARHRAIEPLMAAILDCVRHAPPVDATLDENGV